MNREQEIEMEKVANARAHISAAEDVLVDNPQKIFLYQHLTSIATELESQLSNMRLNDTIEENPQE
tara:strand:- start:84 stop:281 length:198 start_codon:yes stop_codon:yes gene_type:complete